MRTILNLAGYLALIADPAPGITPDWDDRALSIWPRPYAEVWTTREVFRRGEHARVYFRAESDSHILVLRVDTDGSVSVLFPAGPWSDTFVHGSRRYEIRTSNREAFRVDDFPGQGYLVIVSARDPFFLEELSDGRGWAPEVILPGGRLAGDPYLGIHALTARLVVDETRSHVDVSPYYVEHRFEYPRFLCYDCHSYTPYSEWDPYTYSCIRFRIVIQDDPYYYPARYHGGTRVVYRRADRIEPRYLLRNREAGLPYIAREPSRGGPASISERVRNYTSRDFGGRGSVPAPEVISSRQRITSARTPVVAAETRTVDMVFVERRTTAEPRPGSQQTQSGRTPRASERRIYIVPPFPRDRVTDRARGERETGQQSNRRQVIAPASPPARAVIRVPTRTIPSRVAPRRPSNERSGKVERRRPERSSSGNVRGRRPSSGP